MKKNLLRIIALPAVFAISASISLNLNFKSTSVYAEQHIDNYQEYKYSGNYYAPLAVYDSIATDGLNGTLRKRLSKLILPKAWYTYSGSSSGCLGNELQQADQDPTNNANMVLFYSRDSVSKRAAGGSTSDWNREHVWPQSLSNGHWGKEKAGTDVLHIRPTWYTTNNKRGNTVYGDVNKKNPQTYSGMTYAYVSGSYFEPIDAVKGDVARILMYVWTAYYDYYEDTSLYLTNAIESYDTLLKWHTLDKPDALEGVRNDYSESSKQKNRNPFVDHPEFAWKIFGDSVKDSGIKAACKAAYPDNEQANPPVGSSSSSSSSSISISSESSSSIISSSESSSTSESSTAASSSSEESSSTIASSESSSSNSISESSQISSEESASSIVEESSFESSEIISFSSQGSIVSSSEESSSNNTDKPIVVETKIYGCNSSLLGTVSLTGLIALVGIVFALSKKK